jgi:hypothetical protein
MEIVYDYHHPEARATPKREDDRGGFYNPLSLVIAGAEVHQTTGQYPDPEQLAKSINTRFKGDIDYWHTLIERGRPKETNRPILKPED